MLKYQMFILNVAKASNKEVKVLWWKWSLEVNEAYRSQCSGILWQPHSVLSTAILVCSCLCVLLLVLSTCSHLSSVIFLLVWGFAWISIIALWGEARTLTSFSFQTPALTPLLRYSKMLLLKPVTHCHIPVSAKTTSHQITTEWDSWKQNENLTGPKGKKGSW